MTPIKTLSLDTSDFDELSHAFAGWDQRFDQIGAGKFRGRLTFASLGPVQLFDVALNLPIRARGSRARDFVTLTPVTPRNKDALWHGSRLAPGMVNVRLSEDSTDHRTAADYRMTTILIHRDLLQRTSRSLTGVDLDRLLTGNRPLAIGPRHAARLARRLAASLNGIASSNPVPSMLDHLVGDVVLTLTNGRIQDPIRTTASQRLHVVRRVEEYVDAHPHAPLSILGLCDLTGVSERTLHYAFVEVTGLTPKTYLRALRLNRARRELLCSAPHRGRIAAIALNLGFDRPGTFASDYRKLFGALPSQSLASRHPHRHS